MSDESHAVQVLEARQVAFEKLMDERDRRYDEQFRAQKEAVAAALTAQKEQTGAAFAASEKAIVKAENSQTEYNVRSNEFRGQLGDQANRLLPRAEADTRFGAFEKQIENMEKDVATLRESRSAVGGAKAQTALIFGMAVAIAGLAMTLVLFMIKRP